MPAPASAVSRFFGRRRDGNHFEIVKIFEGLGCTVIDVSQIPCGFDILVGYGGITMPVEIKDPEAENWTKRTKKTRSASNLLTENEKKVHDRWTGGARLVMNADDVAETVNTMRRWHRVLSQHLVNSCGQVKSPP